MNISLTTLFPGLGVLSLAALLAAPSASAQTELLFNGNFNSTASWPAEGWNTWQWPGGGWINRQNSLNGVVNGVDGSDYIAAGRGDGNGSGSVGLYQVVPGQGGLTYSLAVDCGAQAWWAPKGEMDLYFLDANNAILSSKSLVTVDPANVAWDKGQAWARFTITADAPVGTTQVKSEFIANGGWGGGTIFFDNASLQVVPEPGTLSLVALGLLCVLGRRSCK